MSDEGCWSLSASLNMLVCLYGTKGNKLLLILLTHTFFLLWYHVSMFHRKTNHKSSSCRMRMQGRCCNGLYYGHRW